MSVRGNYILSGVSARIFTSVIGAAVMLSLAPSLLFGQANLGRLSGNVRDQLGGAIVGAAVSVVDADRGPERDVVTDEAGGYVLSGLIPGRKTVHAEFRGFRAFEQANIALGVGQDARLDITLQPGALTETIRVTEAPPLLDTNSAELGGTIENQAINDLPLNGRNFENLLDLRPGVTKYPGNSGWTQSTNGLRPHDNFFMVDGINSNDPWMAQSIMNAVMAAGDAGTILPIDAIDEFRTQQNPRAEFGWKPGAVVNVGIKSGTTRCTARRTPTDATARGTPLTTGRRQGLPLHRSIWNSSAVVLAGPSAKTSFSFSEISRSRDMLWATPCNTRCPSQPPARDRLLRI